ncbi:hypothetical protein PPERSA_04445 [Pseudocohnilembus persalinus]|uniref:Cytosol aminopeptidase domain-containing protein n=1 Tax=Pseudocohnilembus persalinus TaxID=266149 RepID=A0A0V0QQV6_PSEPJ|nr:hypothetical protein PPERSA_04445 [Pseudocohnilembus persalinus]|eukprot:KRX04630.1 hypothetical protein PPERSA_04445 [Pseudocohnilembus persalinus]
MATFEKFNQIQNQQSFVPTFTHSKEISDYKNLVILLAQEDVAQPPAFLQTTFKNEVFVQDFQKTSTVIYGTSEDKFQKALVLFVKSKVAKDAFKSARTHLKKIVEIYRCQESINFYFSSNLDQTFLNEYVYGLFTENYQWQLKSQGEQENKTIFHSVKNFNLVSANLHVENPQFQYLTQVVKYQLYGKELINTRANIANTEWMAQQAIQFQSNHSSKVQIEVIRGKQLLEKGLNLMHAVGRASTSEPILVVLSYKGNPEHPEDVTALVGKGVVYDCGGLSLKQSLTDCMHGDKGGACAVLSAFRGAVELGVKQNVVGTLALVENMISGDAYRNSDIITTLKGLNVEVLNTDAEGRNILADALAYTQMNYKPKRVIDLATLTGACLVAVGLDTGAVFSNDEELQWTLKKISQDAHENLHPLPLTDWMRENIVSDQGDIRNLGKQPYGGAGTAAAFLEKFIEKGVQWAHFDIAQASMTKGELLQVRTLIDFLRSL